VKAAEVRTFGVVGAGQMGSGIAQVAALAGLEVVLEDVAQAFVDRGVLAIEKSLERAVEKGKLSKDDGERARGRIRTTTSLADFKDCDFVVEAVTEDAALKREAFRELDAVLLLSLGRHEALPRAAAVELGLDEGRVHGGAGPQALDRAADEGAVARPEEGRAVAHADRVHGTTSKAAPRARRSSRKVG